MIDLYWVNAKTASGDVLLTYSACLCVSECLSILDSWESIWHDDELVEAWIRVGERRIDCRKNDEGVWEVDG